MVQGANVLLISLSDSLSADSDGHMARKYKACRHLDEYVFAGKPCSYKRRLRDGERRAAKTGMKHVRAADGVVLTTASVIF